MPANRKPESLRTCKQNKPDRNQLPLEPQKPSMDCIISRSFLDDDDDDEDDDEDDHDHQISGAQNKYCPTGKCLTW